MNLYKKRVSQACGVLITFFTASPVIASTTIFNPIPVSEVTVTGGAMTLNIDKIKLAAAFTHDNDPLRPSIYLEEYFDAAQAASRTPSELLTDHIIPGAGEISAIGRQLAVNSSSTNGFNVANDFSFLASDLTGTASGAIGLGGAMRYRLDVPFTINPATGEEENNRTMTGYFSLEYDNSRVDTTAGHSGWAIFNHHTFRADVFGLDNVVTHLTGNSLTLSGDLALATGFDHLGGSHGAIVGGFSFQTSVVPVPATVWLFSSGLAGLFISGRAKKKVMP